MPTTLPPWLPDIVSVSGNWNQVLRMLYGIFDHDFRQTGCEFQGRPVWWDQKKTEKSPYEEVFWHLITKFDHSQQDRLLDPRRAERLPWCKPTIVNSFRSEVLVWDYKEARGKIRTYVWLHAWNYVIVLQKRQLRNGSEVAFLITAFHVGGNSTRKSLQKKFEKRVK